MTLKIKEALETIRPNDDLIRNTELMLRAKSMKKHTQFYQKLSIAACLVFIVGAMSLSGYCYYQYPVNYLDIDINPSLELDVNRFDRVVNVKYFNEDAQNLIDKSTLCGNKSENAVALVLEAAKNSGYISKKNTTVVSLAVASNESSGEDKTATLLETCTNTIESQYNNIAVYSATVSSDMKREADSASISAGKLHLIKMIQTLDKTATIDNYRDDSVSNIFDKLTYLTSDANTSVSAGNKAGILEGIKGITDRIKQSNENKQVPSQSIPPSQNNTQSTGDSQSQSNSQIQPEANSDTDLPVSKQSASVKPSQEPTNDTAGETTGSVQTPPETPKSSDSKSKNTAPVNHAPPVQPSTNIKTDGKRSSDSSG